MIPNRASDAGPLSHVHCRGCGTSKWGVCGDCDLCGRHGCDECMHALRDGRTLICWTCREALRDMALAEVALDLDTPQQLCDQAMAEAAALLARAGCSTAEARAYLSMEARGKHVS